MEAELEATIFCQIETWGTLVTLFAKVTLVPKSDTSAKRDTSSKKDTSATDFKACVN